MTRKPVERKIVGAHTAKATKKQEAKYDITYPLDERDFYYSIKGLTFQQQFIVHAVRMCYMKGREGIIGTQPEHYNFGRQSLSGEINVKMSGKSASDVYTDLGEIMRSNPGNPIRISNKQLGDIWKGLLIPSGPLLEDIAEFLGSAFPGSEENQRRLASALKDAATLDKPLTPEEFKKLGKGPLVIGGGGRY